MLILSVHFFGSDSLHQRNGRGSWIIIIVTQEHCFKRLGLGWMNVLQDFFMVAKAVTSDFFVVLFPRT